MFSLAYFFAKFKHKISRRNLLLCNGLRPITVVIKDRKVNSTQSMYTPLFPQYVAVFIVGMCFSIGFGLGVLCGTHMPSHGADNVALAQTLVSIKNAVGAQHTAEDAAQRDKLCAHDAQLKKMEERLNGIDATLSGYQDGWTVHVEGEYVEVWPPALEAPIETGGVEGAADSVQEGEPPVVWYREVPIIYDEKTSWLEDVEGDAE